MNSLKRQASKAERYAKLRDEMRDKLRIVLASKFAQFDGRAASLWKRSSRRSAKKSTAKAKPCKQMEAEHTERTSVAYSIEREGRRIANSSTLALELDRAAARRRTNEERCAELEARSAGAQAEIARPLRSCRKLQQELEANRATLESANADVTAAQQELQQRQQEAAAAAAT